MNPTVASALLAVKLPASGNTHSHGVTGGVYKARERIHREVRNRSLIPSLVVNLGLYIACSKHTSLRCLVALRTSWTISLARGLKIMGSSE